MLKTEDVLKRTEELLALKKKHTQSDQIEALAQAMVEAVNVELRDAEQIGVDPNYVAPVVHIIMK